MSIVGDLAAPATAQTPIPVPLAELFTAAAAHEQADRLDEADRVLGHVLAAVPEQADALHLAGIVALRRGRRAEALALMRRSLVQGAHVPHYWRNITEALRLAGLPDEALEAGRRAATLAPEDPVALVNLAIVHMERLEFDAAEACLSQALALDPAHASAHFGLAEVLLMRGDYARGWEEYQWRFHTPGGAGNLPPTGGAPRWDGRPLPARRLLVVADQGFGDNIQFGRFIPRVLERCPDPVFACSPEARPLLARLGAVTLVDRWEAVGTVDAMVTLSGLPRVFGTRLDTIPTPVPYLSADPERATAWRTRLDGLVAPALRRIGLAWAGRPTHGNDHRRSASLAILAPLLALPGFAFVSLQKGERQAEIGAYFGPAPLVNLGPDLRGWEDTLAVVAGLDAVVCVDTAMAHLAGALGRPAHVLLAHAGEWRWLVDRADSPWYPTLRLHRQPQAGDWAGAVGSVVAALGSGAA